MMAPLFVNRVVRLQSSQSRKQGNRANQPTELEEQSPRRFNTIFLKITTELVVSHPLLDAIRL